MKAFCICVYVHKIYKNEIQMCFYMYLYMLKV